MRTHVVPLSILLVFVAGCCCPDSATQPIEAPPAEAGTNPEPAPLVVPEPPAGPTVAGAPAPVSEPARHLQAWLAASDRALETRTHATSEHAVASNEMHDAEMALRQLAATDPGHAKVMRVFDLMIGELRDEHAATEGRLHQLQRVGRKHSPAEEAWIRTAPEKLKTIERRIATVAELKARVTKR